MFGMQALMDSANESFENGKVEGRKEMEAALMTACKYIVEMPQPLDEVQAAETWFERFVEEADAASEDD